MPLEWGPFLTVGLAMSAWGEFAFLTATTARSAEIIDQRAFASVILAVVVSVVVSPVLLRLVLRRTGRTAVSLIEGASAPSTQRCAADEGAAAVASMRSDAQPPRRALGSGVNARNPLRLATTRGLISHSRGSGDVLRAAV